MKKLILGSLIIGLLSGCTSENKYEKIEQDLTKIFDNSMIEYSKQTDTDVNVKKLKIFECKEKIKNINFCSIELTLISREYGEEKATITAEIIKSNNNWKLNENFNDETLYNETKIYRHILDSLLKNYTKI